MADIMRLPRFMRPNRKPEQYGGFDAQMECLAGCIEELNILESKMGAGARRQTLEWVQERFAREDRERAERALDVSE